ncbi:helix-turn-helix domain-containing protein [Bacteriovoracaceae bacterium]|nr:helix-turn-helix domain-containing protein [Bacteriovoracaceae bacterium]
MTKFPSDKELKRVRGKLDEGIASRPLPKDASIIDQTKFKLCQRFIVYKNIHGLTQRALAKIIGIDESLVSKILHYHFEEFTTDRLINYLSTIHPDLNINVDVA